MCLATSWQKMVFLEKQHFLSKLSDIKNMFTAFESASKINLDSFPAFIKNPDYDSMHVHEKQFCTILWNSFHRNCDDNVEFCNPHHNCKNAFSRRCHILWNNIQTNNSKHQTISFTYEYVIWCSFECVLSKNDGG